LGLFLACFWLIFGRFLAIFNDAPGQLLYYKAPWGGGVYRALGDQGGEALGGLGGGPGGLGGRPWVPGGEALGGPGPLATPPPPREVVQWLPPPPPRPPWDPPWGGI